VLLFKSVLERGKRPQLYPNIGRKASKKTLAFNNVLDTNLKPNYAQILASRRIGKMQDQVACFFKKKKGQKKDPRTLP